MTSHSVGGFTLSVLFNCLALRRCRLLQTSQQEVWIFTKQRPSERGGAARQQERWLIPPTTERVGGESRVEEKSRSGFSGCIISCSSTISCTTSSSTSTCSYIISNSSSSLCSRCCSSNSSTISYSLNLLHHLLFLLLFLHLSVWMLRLFKPFA